jgi:hypothetical protein
MTLTKSQQREVSRTVAHMSALGADFAARSLSALYRSARRESQQREILAIALAYSLVTNPEFII